MLPFDYKGGISSNCFIEMVLVTIVEPVSLLIGDKPILLHALNFRVHTSDCCLPKEGFIIKSKIYLSNFLTSSSYSILHAHQTMFASVKSSFV